MKIKCLKKITNWLRNRTLFNWTSWTIKLRNIFVVFNQPITPLSLPPKTTETHFLFLLFPNISKTGK